jgi:hypothetical protein
MMKNLKVYLALVLILINGCTTSKILPDVSINPPGSPTPSTSPGSVPVINLGNINSGGLVIDVIQNGGKLANKMLASDCFRLALLDSHFTETNGLKPADIWALMIKEVLTLDVEVFYGSYAQNHFSKTMGYENDNEPGKVYANSYFIYTAYDFGDLLVHEWAHKLGFTHYQVKETSVPYGMNSIYESCSPRI